ncbi:MAG: serine hydrolase domain-containing protein, partial [Pseudomonadales bacterium]
MIDTVSPESVGLSSARLERVSAWLEAQISGERVAGASVLVGRRGGIPYFEARGLADVAAGKSFERDTIVRIYSMTKPVTTVAAMMLYEEGCFQLDDPVAKYLPEFAATRVWAGGDAPLTSTVAVQTPMTVHHLMTHTSGLTYGFMQANVVDAAYREAKMDFPGGPGSLEEQVRRLAEIPLICQPGSEWNYSASIDVLGRLVEVWSGMSLAEFFQQRLFDPLDMRDAGFHVAKENHDRFAACYAPPTGGNLAGVGRVPSPADVASRTGGLKLQDPAEGSRFLQPATLYAGGGGLTASMRDYARFCQMLIRGGELDGAR